MARNPAINNCFGKSHDALIINVVFVNSLRMYDLKPVELTRSQKNNKFVCIGTGIYKI